MLLRSVGRSVAARGGAARSFHATVSRQAKIVCVLYPDPLEGYPPKYVRDGALRFAASLLLKKHPRPLSVMRSAPLLLKKDHTPPRYF